MRFFLALWVILYHECAASAAGLWNPLFALLRTGYIAVGMFFVLSGFVLSYNYQLEDKWSRAELCNFAAGRIARIYPIYLLGLLIMAPFFLVDLIKHMSFGLFREQSSTLLLNSFLLQSWIPTLALGWNPPGWSLCDEAFFYLCFPFIGRFIWRLSRPHNLFSVASIVWLLALIAPLFAVIKPIAGFGTASATTYHLDCDPFWKNLVMYSPALRIPDFALGILIGRAAQRLRASNHTLVEHGYWLYIPALLALLGILAHSQPIPLPLLHNGLLLPLYGCVVLGLALGGGVVCEALSSRAIVFLGNASYAMYIIHVPIATWRDWMFRHLHLSGNAVATTTQSLLYVLIVVFLSSVIFRYIEQPANQLLRKHLGRKLEQWLPGKPGYRISCSPSVER